MSNSKIEDAIAIPKTMLTISGLWPRRDKDLLYKMKIFVSTIISVFLAKIVLVELIRNITHIDIITDHLCLYATTMSYLIKYAIFAYKESNVLDIVRQIHQQSFNNYPNRLDFYTKRTIRSATFIARLYQSSCLVVIVLYSLKPLIMENINNTALPVQASFNTGIFYFPLYFLEVFGLAATCWNNSCLDALAMQLMNIGSSQLDILAEKLINVTQWAGLSAKEIDEYETKAHEEPDDNHVAESLKNCVIHHMDIIQYVFLGN